MGAADALFLPLDSWTAREHKNESMAPLSHRGSSRVTAIRNVIPAISTWPKRAMVNSICSLVSICLIPRQWTRCAEWQRSVNESLHVGHAASCEALSVAMGSLFEERDGAAPGLLSFTNPASHKACRSALNMTFRYSGVLLRPP